MFVFWGVDQQHQGWQQGWEQLSSLLVGPEELDSQQLG
jgi:hypothetical protein